MKGIILFILSFSAFATEWQSHQACGRDSKSLKRYCLEIKEHIREDREVVDTLIFFPGLLQNFKAFDLLPEDNISFVKYIENKMNVRVFVAHYRGVEGSELPSITYVEDIATDDIRLAFKFVREHTGKKPYAMGHSLGSILLQAYFGGATRLPNGVHFNRGVALARKQEVKAIGLIAGTNYFKFSPRNFFVQLANIVKNLKVTTLLRKIPYIEVGHLSRLGRYVTWSTFWNQLYLDKNAEEHVEAAMFEKSVSSTTGQILGQLLDVVGIGPLQTKKGVSFLNGQQHIKTPVYQVSMQEDPLSPPADTEYSFSLIGSSNKVFEVIPDQAHLDFYMSQKMHMTLDKMMDFLLRH